MKYVVFGAGAIGAVVGGRLCQAGLNVTLIARGAHLEALQAHGLRLESPAGADLVRLASVGHPGEIDWRGNPVVLLAVKSQQTLAALGQLAEVAPPQTPIVCLQNGIANEPAALRLFPNVQAVSVACPTSHLEPGSVQAWSTPVTGLLDIGRYPTGIDHVSEAVAADFRAATFSSYPVEDIRRWKNRKLLTNLGNAIEAVCGPDERVGPLGDLLLAEGEAVLAAAGLEAATPEEDRTRRADLLQPGEIAGQRRPGGSSWQSLRRGTGEIETDYLNGEIVLLGRLHGVPTPANELLQQLARKLANARDAPGATPAATILERLDRGPVEVEQHEARVHNPSMSQGAEPSVPPDKQSLRRQLRAQRRSLAPQRDRGSDAAAIAAAAGAFLDTLPLPATGSEHPSYGEQPCVAIYRALPTEPPTDALAAMLHARGAAVIVPEMLPDRDLDWHELRADGTQGPGLGLAAIAAAGVVLMPALAVDHSGTRLGQGGGSYDRAVARRRPDAVLVAIVNDVEYAAWPLPRDAHDVPVNAVITPGRGLTPITAPGPTT